MQHFGAINLKLKYMEVNISKEQLISTLKNVESVRKKGGNLEIYRAGGVLEGILYTLGEIKPKENFEFKEIEYTEIGWFGKKKIKKRKQTYIEFMIEKIENLINTIDDTKTRH